MAAKNIDWANLGFGYMKTDYRYVSNYKNGSWDQGALTTDDQILLNECACVFQYAQTCFEGRNVKPAPKRHGKKDWNRLPPYCYCNAKTIWTAVSPLL